MSVQTRLTLLVDAEGIYDPGLLNDRLLLGLKGTMSEFELGILRQRAQEAYRQKVLRGEVLTIVPVGFVRSHACTNRSNGASRDYCEQAGTPPLPIRRRLDHHRPPPKAGRTRDARGGLPRRRRDPHR